MSANALFTRDRAASRPFVIAMSVIGSVLLVSAAIVSSAMMSRGGLEAPMPLAGPGPDPDPAPAAESTPVAKKSPALEDKDIAIEALSLENTLLRESGQRIAADGGGKAGNKSASSPPINDPAAAEAVAIARSMRNAGDMAGALAQLRSAEEKIGEHPRILYAKADVYQAMGLTVKATQAWEVIREIGPSAGDFYEMAILRLGYTDPAFTPAKPDNSIFIGRAALQLDDDKSDGETVVVRLSLQSRSEAPLDVPKVYIDIQFYDLINSQSVDVNRTKLSADSWNWVTQPIDWKDGEELLDISYHLSVAGSKEVPGERRQYYGFVAKLYYKDHLQDVYMHPRTLHEDILEGTGGGASREMEASLFPDE